MCIHVALLKTHQELSSYELAFSESRSSPLCLVLVRSLKVGRGPLWWSMVFWAAYLEGSMAKIEYDEGGSPLGASLAVLRNQG